MKKIVSILLVVILMLSFSGCLLKEQKQKIEMYEKNAEEVMTDFLKKHYDNFEILDIEHIKYVNSGSVRYTLGDSTKVFVKIDNEKYNFYYNQITEEIFSDINMNKVKEEFNEYFNNNDFPKDYYEKNMSISYQDYEYENNVLKFEDDTLEKIIERNNNSDKACYKFFGNFYYLEKDMSYDDFKLKDFAKKFRDISFHFYNVTKDYNNNPFSFNVLEKYSVSYDDGYNENIKIDIYEYETVEKDGVYFVYTPRYFDIEFDKEVKDRETLIDNIYNKTYDSNGIWYKISSTKLYDSYPQAIIGDEMEISYTVSPGVSIFVKTDEHKNKGLYIKRSKYADESNSDDSYMRFFIFLDNEEKMVEEITFVDLK